jgi:acyl carrier protein
MMHESQADTGPGTSVTAAQVADLVARVLDRLDVAPDDDFFLLGGSSLLAMRLLDLVTAEFGVTLSARQFYLNTRVDQLAGAINSLRTPA